MDSTCVEIIALSPRSAQHKHKCHCLLHQHCQADDPCHVEDHNRDVDKAGQQECYSFRACKRPQNCSLRNITTNVLHYGTSGSLDGGTQCCVICMDRKKLLAEQIYSELNQHLTHSQTFIVIYRIISFCRFHRS